MISIVWAVLLRCVPPVRARGGHRRGRGESTVDRTVHITATRAPARPRIDPRLLARVWAGVA